MNEDFDLYEGLDDISRAVEDEGNEIETDSSDDGITFLVNDTPETSEHSENKSAFGNYVEISSHMSAKPPKYAENPNINSYLLLCNLDWYVTQSQIYQTATTLGQISYLYLFEHPVSGKFLGLALIQYSSAAAAKIALDSLPQLFNNRIKVHELDDEVYSRLANITDLHINGRVPGFLLEKMCNIANVPLPTKSNEISNSDAEFERVQQQLIDAGDFKSAMGIFPWFQFDIFKLLRPLVASYKTMPKRNDYIKLTCTASAKLGVKRLNIRPSKSPVVNRSMSPRRRSAPIDRPESLVEPIELERKSIVHSSRYRDSHRDSAYRENDSYWDSDDHRGRSRVRDNNIESRYRSRRSRSRSRSRHRRSREKRDRSGSGSRYKRRSRSRDRDSRRRHRKERQPSPIRRIIIERK